VVTDFLPVEGTDETRLLALVAGAEQHSEHFLARAIAAYCRARAVPSAPTFAFAAVPGQGVQAQSDGAIIRIGNAAFLASAGIDCTVFAPQAEAF
ncbi:MAG: hypothetical protein ACK4MZ_10925, partial [Thermomonas haemolytica]